MSEKKRWEEIDILRGMAILMVLLYHSIIVFPINLHEIEWCRTLHGFLWTIQMPLFFLVSGFCFSYPTIVSDKEKSSGDRTNLAKTYAGYLWKKCKRILVPHIVFSALDILPRLIPNPLVNELMEPKEAILDFLLYGGNDWFLWTLFVIVVVFPLFDKLFRGGRVLGAVGIALAVILFACKPFVTDFLLFNMVSQYLLYYMLGYFLRRKTKYLSEKKDGCLKLLLGFVGMLACYAGFLAIRQNQEYFAYWLEFICVIFSFLFFIALSKYCKGICAGFLTLCGKWSLQMYLLDAYALVLTRTVFVKICGINSPIVIILGNFVLDTVIVLFIAKYILAKVKGFRLLCGIPERV